MQEIQPVEIWINGITKTAKYLDAVGIQVTLGVSARFDWHLLTKVIDADGNDQPGEIIAQGNLDMIGDDYLEWQADAFAWEWVADQLNLVII
jgi:hypothetical protein